jgi:hypothetical protein
METKMWVGFVFAAVYLLIAVKSFLYVFAEGKWLNIFYAQNIFKELDAEAYSQKVSSKHI